MRVLWIETKYLKSDAILFIRSKIVRTFKWNTIHLCDSRGYKIAKVKFEGPKNVAEQTINIGKTESTLIFLGNQTLYSGRFEAPWATRMHSIPIESPQFFNGMIFGQECISTLRSIISIQSTPIYVLLIY